VTRHFDAEILARYDEGDLRPWQSWRIRFHLSRCAQCRTLNSELAGVSALLASVPEPPMPQHLYVRIEVALAREAAMRAASGQDTVTAAHPATASGPATAPAAQELTPAKPRPDSQGDWDEGSARHRRQARWWLPKWSAGGPQVAARLATAAALLLVVGVGSYELTQHTGGTHSAPSTAPRTAPAAGAAPSVGYGPSLHYTYSGQPHTITPITTHTNFTLAQLRRQLSQIPGSPPGAQSPIAAPNARSSSAPSNAKKFGNILVSDLDGCVNRIAAGNQVLLVDVAEFQGAPAIIIVTEGSGAGPEQIWVVGTGCSAGNSDVLDHSALPAGG
jgi:hypothetical protein